MIQKRRWLILLVLLIAAALRLYGLNNLSPPGLEHDEVANWLIDRSILEGNHAIYFSEAYGHEAGFHYLQTIFVALLGDHALALRLPAAFAGILLTAVTYTLSRQLFGQKVGLWAMALTAVLFWPVFYGRLGLRAIALPLLSGLSAYFWWKGIEHKGTKTQRPPPFVPLCLRVKKFFLPAGIFAGLSIHTYMAARAVPIFYGLFTLYLALFHWPTLKKNGRGILAFWIAFIAIAAPLVFYLQANPAAEFRTTEIDAPLRALLGGDFAPVFHNGIKILGAFGFVGDPLWRQGVAGIPIFGPALAFLFYAGVGVALWRWRDGRYAFLILWLIASVSPSLVTVDAPSTIRMINLLPVLTLFTALFPIAVMHNLGRLSTVIPKLSTENLKIGGKILLTILIVWNIGRTIWLIFGVWPHNPEVEFVWQRALTETAVYLDQSPDAGPVAIGGWSPATMDPPTMELTLRRDDLDLRYFGSDSTAVPLQTIIIPAATDAAARLTHPTIRPLAQPLIAALQNWGAMAQEFSNFTLYQLPIPPPRPTTPTQNVVFGGELRLLGYDDAHLASDGTLITYWETAVTPTGNRRFFLHALDADGNIIAQHDGLDAPAPQWQPGDIIIQAHELGIEGANATRLRLGVYDPDTCAANACQNLTTQDGAAFVMIPAK